MVKAANNGFHKIMNKRGCLCRWCDNFTFWPKYTDDLWAEKIPQIGREFMCFLWNDIASYNSRLINSRYTSVSCIKLTEARKKLLVSETTWWERVKFYWSTFRHYCSIEYKSKLPKYEHFTLELQLPVLNSTTKALSTSE